MRFAGLDIRRPSANDLVAAFFTVLFASAVMVIFLPAFFEERVIFSWIMAGASGALLSSIGVGANKGSRQLTLNIVLNAAAAGAGYAIYPFIF